jgi:hypothetical protein
MTLTSRTPKVTGGSHRSSTMRSRSASASVTCPHKPECHLVNGIVVVAQRLCVAGDDGDLVGAMTVARVRDVQRQPEPLRPTPRRPDLVSPCDICDVVVLDPGQMPYQPGDRVGLAVEAERQFFGRQAAHREVHGVADPSERVSKQASACHLGPSFAVVS